MRQYGTLEQRNNTLTPLRIKILRLIAQGLSDPDIAARLNRKCSTIKSHIQTIRKQLHIHDRRSLTIYALKAGLISLDEIEMPNDCAEKEMR
jgi:DNA-binding NarL/FixJ family response regulator